VALAELKEGKEALVMVVPAPVVSTESMEDKKAPVKEPEVTVALTELAEGKVG
jgi:hypothetical protein